MPVLSIDASKDLFTIVKAVVVVFTEFRTNQSTDLSLGGKNNQSIQRPLFFWSFIVNFGEKTTVPVK